MTIRITVPARTLALTVLATALAGCSTISNLMESDKVDYHAAHKAPTLEVPPDLTQLAKDNRYAVPDARGTATASSLQQAGSAAPAVAGEAVGPISTDAVRIVRDGDARWLVVKATPEQLWPTLKDFWHDNGFNLETESPATGVLETAWNENRAKIPQDFIRNTIGKVFDGLYSTGERDKYRTRLERNPDGTTDIFISHRGVEEVYSGPQKESTVWQPRARDPGLEAIFLAKLMARLENKPVKEVQPLVQNAAPLAVHAKLAGSTVEVDEGFDRAWRRVGLALDRMGFTVEDRDRVQGIYFVRYVDPDAAKNDGFFAKLLTFGDTDKDKEAQRYRVLVKADSGATVSAVTVQSNDGKTDGGPTGARILKLLVDELK